MTESIKKQHLKYLVAIAMADGRLDKNEREFLLERAATLGYSRKEIERIIQNTEIESVIVDGSPREREELLADAILMTIIDGDIDEKELLLVKEIAVNFQFSSEFVRKLVDRANTLWKNLN